jgi:anti-sigma factor RsiW
MLTNRETIRQPCSLSLRLDPTGEKTMDHTEAVEQMAVERYLLNEMTPEVREAFEQHYFDCQECALDLRAGAAFVNEAKAQLPGLTAPSAQASSHLRAKPGSKRPWWSFLWQPAFAAPVFATMLAVIAYQNFATIPSLRADADQPRLLPWVSVHTGTRGAAHVPVTADQTQGAVVLIDTPQNLAYTSYAFELYDPQGKQFWTRNFPISDESVNATGTLSLFIPGSSLKQGSYTLVISGVNAQGEHTRIDQRILDVKIGATK